MRKAGLNLFHLFLQRLGWHDNPGEKLTFHGIVIDHSWQNAISCAILPLSGKSFNSYRKERDHHAASTA